MDSKKIIPKSLKLNTAALPKSPNFRGMPSIPYLTRAGIVRGKRARHCREKTYIHRRAVHISPARGTTRRTAWATSYPCHNSIAEGSARPFLYYNVNIAQWTGVVKGKPQKDQVRAKEGHNLV
jgi:hypothetical protein